MKKIADIYADRGIVVRSKVPQVHFILIVLIAAMAILVIQSFVQGNYIRVIFIGVSLVAVISSMIMLYRGNYHFSSNVPLVIWIMLVVTVSATLDPESRYQIYVVTLFVTVPLVLSLAISESEWYTVIVASIGFPTILLISFIKIRPVVLLAEGEKAFSLALITSLVAYLLIVIFSILISRSNRITMENVEKSSKDAIRILNEIVQISNNAQSSLDTSKSVESDYTHVQESVEKIRSQIIVLEESIVSLRDNMKNAIVSINSTTARVSDFDGQVDDQNSVVLESTAAVNEMSASLDSVAEITNKKKESSEMLLNVVNEGIKSLELTNTSFKTAENEMTSLLGINSIISGIADQTNLLSMNAAIEAAHAGEAGKGFAVVAGEIRKLAGSTAENSLTISNTLKRIMDSISATGLNVDKSAESMKKILEEVMEVARAFQEITGATSELSISGREIMSAMQLLQNSSVVIREGSLEISNDQKQVNKEMGNIGNVIEAIKTASNGVNFSISMINESLEHLQGTITISMSQSVELHGSINSLADGLN